MQIRRATFCCFAFLLAALPPSKAEVRHIAVVSAHTGHYYLLAPKTDLNAQGSASFSPDHTLIAFDATEDGESFSEVRLLVTKADGSQAEPTNLCSGAMPSFSKSGKRIAFSRPSRGVWVMDADGKNEKCISPRAWHIVFSPVDDDVVAYGMGNNIEVRNLDTDETYQLIPDEDDIDYSQIIWNFQWSQDAKSIAFSGRKSKGGLVIAKVGTEEDNELHEILAAEENLDRVCFHPQTHELFYTAKSPELKGRWCIFSLDPAAPLAYRKPRYFLGQPHDRTNHITDWSDDGMTLLIATTEADGDLRTSPDHFNGSLRPKFGALAQLKWGRELVRTEKYETFVEEIMSGVADDAKLAATELVAEKSEYWLILLAEAIDKFYQAEKDGDKIQIPLEISDSEMNLVFEDGQWRLAVE